MNSIRIPLNRRPYPAPPTHPYEDSGKEKSRYQQAADSWEEFVRSLRKDTIPAIQQLG